MQPRLIVAVLAVVTVAAAAFVLMAGAAAPPATAVFYEVEVKRTVGKESDTWRTRVYTRAGKFVGTGVMACVPTSAIDSLQQCNGTYLLPQGRVAVAGLLSSRAGFTFVVLGGTDTYLGVNGSLVATQQSTRPRRSTLTFFFK